MFIRRFELFTMLGFPIRVDVSWIIIALLVTWSLAAGLFPHWLPDRTPTVYWIMGVIGALGLFISILLHELAHAVAARQFGIRMNGITLFIFGGVAEMQDEPPSAKAEFVVAIAGPIASIVLTAAFAFVAAAGRFMDLPGEVYHIGDYLAIINGLLVVFNMIPAFPLDGGRVLRSAIWQATDDLRKATRITSTLGGAFGMGLILLGVLQLLVGGVGMLVSAMWLALIGIFLRNAAQMSYQQLLVRRVLEGEPVRRFMKTDVVTVPADTDVESLISDYLYRYYYKMYPVVDTDGTVVGCVTTKQVREVSPDGRTTTTVRDIAAPRNEDTAINVDADSMQALSVMSRTGASRLMVMEGDDLVGIIALKDLLQFLSLKVELEAGEDVRVGQAQ